MALDKKNNFLQRLEFIRFYAKWVKSVPNEVWSEQQAVLINSMIKNARNFMMSCEEYLRSKERCKKFGTDADRVEKRQER